MVLLALLRWPSWPRRAPSSLPRSLPPRCLDGVLPPRHPLRTHALPGGLWGVRLTAAAPPSPCVISASAQQDCLSSATPCPSTHSLSCSLSCVVLSLPLLTPQPGRRAPPLTPPTWVCRCCLTPPFVSQRHLGVRVLAAGQGRPPSGLCLKPSCLTSKSSLLSNFAALQLPPSTQGGVIQSRKAPSLVPAALRRNPGLRLEPLRENRLAGLRPKHPNKVGCSCPMIVSPPPRKAAYATWGWRCHWGELGDPGAFGSAWMLSVR